MISIKGMSRALHPSRMIALLIRLHPSAHNGVAIPRTMNNNNAAKLQNLSFDRR